MDRETGTDIVIRSGTGIGAETERGNGIATGNVVEIVRGHERGTVEVVMMEVEEWIGDPGKVEMVPGIGTKTEAGLAPLSGMVTGVHLEVLITEIRNM